MTLLHLSLFQIGRNGETFNSSKGRLQSQPSQGKRYSENPPAKISTGILFLHHLSANPGLAVFMQAQQITESPSVNRAHTWQPLIIERSSIKKCHRRRQGWKNLQFWLSWNFFWKNFASWFACHTGQPLEFWVYNSASSIFGGLIKETAILGAILAGVCTCYHCIKLVISSLR